MKFKTLDHCKRVEFKFILSSLKKLTKPPVTGVFKTVPHIFNCQHNPEGFCL